MEKPGGPQERGGAEAAGDAEEPGGAEEVRSGGPVVRTLGTSMKWFVAAIGAGLATIIGTVLLATWSQAQDAWADYRETPRLTGSVYSPVGTGDHFAFRQAIRGGPGGILHGSDPDEGKLVAFIARERGAWIGSMNVTIVLQGQRRDPLRVVDVRPRVRRSMPNAAGTCFRMPSSASSDVFKVIVSLDDLYQGRKAKQGGHFLDKNIDLAYGERASVDFTVTAQERAYEWDIQVDYVYGHDTSVQHAYFTAPDGQPFRLTGRAPAYRVAYDSPTLAAVFRVAGRNRPCR
ncbi:hypothetical protein ACWEN6_10050 [Sphaerisporangium sp. NPDC004334]